MGCCGGSGRTTSPAVQAERAVVDQPSTVQWLQRLRQFSSARGEVTEAIRPELESHQSEPHANCSKPGKANREASRHSADLWKVGQNPGYPVPEWIWH